MARISAEGVHLTWIRREGMGGVSGMGSGRSLLRGTLVHLGRLGDDPIKFVPVLMLLFGCLFLVLIPPGYNADEPHHVFRGYQLSTFEVLGHPVANDEYTVGGARPGEPWGGAVPTGLTDLFVTTQVYPISGEQLDGPARTGAIDYGRVFSEPVGSSTINVGFANVSGYSPLVYAPTVLAFWVGVPLELPAGVIVYLARVLSLIVGVAITTLALRLMPFGRWLIAVLALLPTTVNLMAAVSADTLTIALAFLATALTLRYATMSRRLGPREWLSLAAVMALVGLTKPSYGILAGLMLAIPFLNHAERGWGLVRLGGAVILAAVPALAWQLTVREVPPSFANPDQVAAQLEFIAGDPFSFVRTLVSTFFTDFGAGRFLYQSFFGSSVWNGVYLPMLFAYLLVGALTAAVAVRAPGEIAPFGDASPKQVAIVKTWSASLFVVGCAVIALGIYIIWSEPRLSVVTGLQGRYFTPICFLALLPFLSQRFVAPPRVAVGVLVVSTLALAVQTTLVAIFLYGGPLQAYWD